MSKIFGIDISYYQTGMDLKKVKDSGVKFAILRAGYTGYGNGISKAKDTEFENFYKNAKANGLGVGAYWFSRATTYENGKAEAKYMYENCLKGKTFEYPIYIDVEDTYYQSKAGKTAVTNAIKGFCEYLENKGYYVGIYGSDISSFKEMMNISDLTDYDKWVARYGSEPKYVKSYGVWQYSSTGRVNGFDKDVDLNYAYKDYPSIMKNNGLNGFTATKTENKVNIPVAPKKSVEELAKEVIEGKWGNGEERKTRLRTAGYSYTAVQTRVNEMLAKPIETIYVVQKGDNLTKIAKKYGTTVNKLVKDNNLSNPNLIYPNQKLVIK